jgi:hypothetical protein
VVEPRPYDGSGERSPRPTLRDDGDGQAGPSEREQGAGVPVGQAETAEGLGAADFFGCRGSVDTVAGAVDADPGHADGIVRTRGEDEFARRVGLGLRGVGEVGRVEGVVGVGDDDGDAEFADGAFLDLAGDADGEVQEEAVGGVEDLQRMGGEADFDAGGGGGIRRDGDRGHAEDGAGRDGVPGDGRVDGLDEAGAGVGAFGDELEGGLVGEGGLGGFFEPGFAGGLEGGEVGGGDGELGERRGVEREGGEGGGVEPAGGREGAGLLESGDGGGGLCAGDAIDGAAGETEAGEGDLGLKDGFDGARVGARRRGRRELDERGGGRSGGRLRRQGKCAGEGEERESEEAKRGHGKGRSFPCGQRDVEGVLGCREDQTATAWR